MKRNRYRYKKWSLRSVALALVMIVCGMAPASLSAKEIFAELAGMNQVESTYISGRMAHNKRLWESRLGSHRMDLSAGFSSLYTYECYSVESVKKAIDILVNYVKKNPDLELVMRSREDSESYEIYERFSDGDKLMEMIIVSRSAPNLCEIVVVNWDNGYIRQ